MKRFGLLMQARNFLAKNFKVNTKSVGFERAFWNELLLRKKIFLLDWHEGRSKVKLWLVVHVAAQNRWQLMRTGRNQSHNKGLFLFTIVHTFSSASGCFL